MPSLEATLRHQAILEHLRQEGQVRVSELSERFAVSAVTIRADLEHLEQQGALRRTRGVRSRPSSGGSNSRSRPAAKSTPARRSGSDATLRA